MLLDRKQPLKKDFGWTCTDQKLSSLENYRPSDAVIHFSSCFSCIHLQYGNNFFYNTVMSSNYFVGLWSVKLNLLHVEVYQNLERDTLILLHELFHTALIKSLLKLISMHVFLLDPFCCSVVRVVVDTLSVV